MSDKISDKDIEEMLERYKDVFESLANNIRCPACEKIVKPPFYNLGIDYHQAEGCKTCFDRIQNE